MRAKLAKAILDEGGRPIPEPPAVSAPGPMLEEFALGLRDEKAKPELAMIRYRRILAAHPESFWASYRAAVCADRLHRRRDAVEYLKRVVARFPENPALLTQLAGCRYRLKEYGEALDLCNRALAIDPDFQEAYRTRWYINVRLGNPRASLGDAQRFASLEGRLASLALWEFNTRRRLVAHSGILPDEAPDDRTSSPPSIDDAEFLVLKGLDLEVKGRIEEALRAYGEAVEADPDHLYARLRHAELSRKLRSPDFLREFADLAEHPRFEDLVAVNEEALRVLHFLADSATARGRFREGIGWARRSLETARRLGLFQGESHYRLAKAHAPLAAFDPDAFNAAVDELAAAAECHPKYLYDWFLDDPAFEPIRGRLELVLGQRLDTAAPRE